MDNPPFFDNGDYGMTVMYVHCGGVDSVGSYTVGWERFSLFTTNVTETLLLHGL